MSATGHHLSPALAVRLAMAKHSPDELQAAEEHASGCPRCRGELEEVVRARERFLAQVFPRTHDAVVQRASWRARWRRLLPRLGLAAALGGAAAALLVDLRPDPPVQAKGAGTLSVYALRGERVFRVEDGARLFPGDRIRFAVQGAGAGFVLVASIDGRGHASVYQPSTSLGPGREAATDLPDSILLDDALGPERIFAFFSPRPVAETEVRRALLELGTAGPEAIRQVRRLPLPYAQVSLCVEKVPER